MTSFLNKNCFSSEYLHIAATQLVSENLIRIVTFSGFVDYSHWGRKWHNLRALQDANRQTIRKRKWMTATHNRNTTTSFICITMTIQYCRSYWTLSMHSTKTLENLETVANGTEISKKTIKPGYSALTGRGRTGSMTGLLSARSWPE